MRTKLSCALALLSLALITLTFGCAASRGGAGHHEELNMTTHTLRKGALTDAAVMAFAVIRDSAACRAFYEGTLGVRVVDDDPQALVLDSGGTIIRMQKSARHEPAPYTVLGWQVRDIRATAQRLTAVGVQLERYEWMPFQDENRIATFPNGDQVAWFKDPEGNVLSIAQLVAQIP